jgi:hypothetical protein
VKHLIHGILKEVKALLEEKTDEVFMAIKRDYTGVIVGQEGNDSKFLPVEQRMMRKSVFEITEGDRNTVRESFRPGR